MIYGIEQRYVEREIRSSHLSHKSIINIHRINTNNSGDLQCAPYLYFKKLNNYSKIDITGYLSYNVFKPHLWLNSVLQNDIILGGGGLLDRLSFQHSIQMLNLLNEKGRKVIPWGVGHNNPSLKVSATFYNQIKKFKLIGIRDYGISGTDWVPCVSCMNSIFDKDHAIKYEMGLIEHENIKISKSFEHLPSICNSSSFEKIIEFIGSVNILLTNSYHAMYWAMLMNKKVVVFPNSSKMLSFKYKVPQCFNTEDYKNYINKTQVYDGLLEECREINRKFATRVFNYLDL